MTHKRFRRGLVVGKFCPLHRGHMLVIDSALDACDEVVVISYTKPEFERCGRAVRQDWIDELYPQVRALVVDDAVLAALGIPDSPDVPHNDASESDHRGFVGWLCLAVLGITVDVVFTSEDYGDGFAAALTAYFSHPVAHVKVDMARTAIPISGTRIRADPHAHREYMHPAVYGSLVKRVCILGGESSGKTTLARALAASLNTVWAEEYGRELWIAQDGVLHYEDMLRIGQVQVAREQAMARAATGWLVCDTTPLTTAYYSRDMFDRLDPALASLAGREYDVTLICMPEFPFEQDGTRRDAEFAQRQHAWYVAELTARAIGYTILQGPLDSRLDQARAALA